MDKRHSDIIRSFFSAYPEMYDKKNAALILCGEGEECTDFFGSLSAYTFNELVTVIDAFILDGVLVKQEKIIANKRVFVIKTGEESSNNEQEKSSLHGVLLLDKLRLWRAKVAKDERVPAYKIVSNKYLEQIAFSMPSSHKQLLAIDGLSPSFVRTHGKTILDIVASSIKKQSSIPPDTPVDEQYHALLESSPSHAFNDDQKRAIYLDHTCIACVAGAGSGKTTVLTHRIVQLLKNKITTPEHILAITFTRKAAKHMKEKLEVALSESSKKITVTTFNAFCEQLLRSISDDKYTIIEDFHKESLLMKALHGADISEEKVLDAMQSALQQTYANSESLFSDFVSLCIDVDNFLHSNDAPVSFLVERSTVCPPHAKDIILILHATLSYYVSLKKAMKIRDYNDQVTSVLLKLREDEQLLNTLRERFTHIFIDEFQDINTAQYALLQLLVHEKTHLFMVGDPRQSIYGFRGSKPEYLLNVTSLFSQSVVVGVTPNYRSGVSIVSLGNAIVEPLHYGFAQIAALREEGNVRIVSHQSAEQEALWVAQTLKELHLAHGLMFSSFMVLARTHAQLDIISRVFTQCDVDFVRRDDKRFEDPLPHQVILSTVHAVKGLEADTVFVCGLVNGVFPLVGGSSRLLQEITGVDPSSAVEEELRLFYVAVTRAKNRLFLSWYGKDESGNKSKSVFLKAGIFNRNYS